MKKTMKVISDIVVTVLFLTMICLALLALSAKVGGGSPSVFGYQVKAVLSGSMEPVFHTGSIIAIKPKEEGRFYEKGDVLTFYRADKMIVTHRVVETIKTDQGAAMYRTKGDANNGPDSEPVLHENVIGEYTGFTIPYVGYILNYTNSKMGAALLLVIPGVLLIGYSITSFLLAWRHADAKEKEQAAKESV